MHGCCTEFDILPHSWQNLLEWLQTRVSAVWIDSARFTGRPGWTRTSDPLLRRQVLYPPELRAHPLETKSIDGFIYVRGNADLGGIFGDPNRNPVLQGPRSPPAAPSPGCGNTAATWLRSRGPSYQASLIPVPRPPPSLVQKLRPRSCSRQDTPAALRTEFQPCLSKPTVPGAASSRISGRRSTPARSGRIISGNRLRVVRAPLSRRRSSG